MRSLKPIVFRALLGIISAGLAAGGASAEGFACRPFLMTTGAPAPLPDVQRRVHDHGPVRILAIGSSSTEGVGASSKSASYPALLGQALGEVWKVPVEVSNAGVGGETSVQTLDRLRDAIEAKHYDLVIWQLGTNDAVKGDDLSGFRDRTIRGIAVARTARTEMVLLDPQFYPAIKDPDRYAAFVEAIKDVAGPRDVEVLTRFTLMKAWYTQDPQSFPQAMATDGFHMSDAGYACLARRMADALTASVPPTR